MIRAWLMRRRHESTDGFRLRGAEITRLEGFSDTVFGFAVTLLVVSLQVPTNFRALLDTMRDLLPFGVCFAVLCYLWYKHYLFFRHYGLQDHMMIVLNSVLLFVILAYVYPLKFLFQFSLSSLVGEQLPHNAISDAQKPALFVIYGLGWAAVYTIFAVFYVHAYRKRAMLKLNSLELFDTQVGIYENLAMVGIGLLSILLALLNVGMNFGLPGWIYFLIAPVQAVIHLWAGRQHRALARQAPKDASMSNASS